MSEYEELTDADLGGPGVEKRQGYVPLTHAIPDPPKELAGEVYESHREGVFKAAANALSRRDEEDRAPAPAMSDPNAEPIERQYNNFKTGEKLPDNQVVEIARASRDLTSARLDEQAEAATALDVELQQAIDALRSGEPEQPQPQEQTYEQPQQPQPEPALEGDDAIFQNPKVIAVLENYNNQVNGAVQQFQAQAAVEVQATASQASAAIFASYPELQGISTPEALNAAVAVIERQNPQRGQQLRNHIATVQQLSAKAQEVQQRQAAEYQQQHRAQFESVAAQADQAFDNWLGSQEPPERMREISSFAKQMLKDEGLSDQEIAHHYNTSPIFRSLTGQRILADAARYRMAQQIARGKAVRQVPTVQRPGSPAARGSEQDYNLGNLRAQLDRSGSVKDATALLIARRGGR